MLYATSPLRASTDADFTSSPSSRIAYDGESLVFGAYSTLSSAFYAHSSRSYRESSLRDTSSPTPSETLTFISDPTENVLNSPFKPTFSAFSDRHYLPASSPALMGAKPITQLSPSTPFQNLFMSSPSGFWNAAISSVSPVFRNPSSEDLRAKKIRSLAEYHRAQQTHNVNDSPSSSSLSSVPSSPADESPGRPLSSLLASALARSSLESNPGVDRHRSVPNVPLTLDPESEPPYMRSYADEISMSRYPTRARTRLVNPGATVRQPSPDKYIGAILSDAQTDNCADVSTKYPRTARKRQLQDNRRASPSRKKSRSDSSVQESTPEEACALSKDYPRRTFPERIPIHEEFPLFYRRFPASSYSKVVTQSSCSLQQLSDATYNLPRSAFDLYTPRYVKGRGVSKVGLCPCCCESVKRGGEGRKLWLSMKFSAFKYYHMQYAHGISVVTGRPFSPPTAFKVTARHHVGKHEKTSIMQGKCHKCQQWVAIEGIKDVPTKVKEIYWWKHAAACHQGSTIEHECDVYVEDDVYRALLDAEAEEFDSAEE